MASTIKALVEPKVLEWARVSAGLSPAEAAKRLNVSLDRLTGWEAGDDRPSLSQLKRLAVIYKRPVAVFYLPEPPRDFMPLKDFRRLPGAHSRGQSSQLSYQIRRAQELREAAIELYAEVGAKPPRFTKQITLGDKPEDVGQLVREMLGVKLAEQSKWSGTYDAFNHWRAAVERQGVLVFQASGIPLDEMRGFSIAQKVAPAIVLNTKDQPNGRMFTLIHELAHLMLRESGICDLDEDDRPPEQRRVEIFCNAVAGATLVPRDDILSNPMIASSEKPQEWSDEELRALSARYRVSREVILRRLLVLGKTTSAFYLRKRQQYIEEYAALADDDKGGFAPPHTKALAAVGKTFARLVLQSYHQDRISLSAVSDFLGVKVKHLPKIEAAL